MKNLSFTGVTLFAGLVLSFAACKKANVLQEKQEKPKKAVEVPSQTELARGEKNIQAVFDKLKRIPTRELVEFSQGSDKKFLNPYILAFDLVYDAQNNTYYAKNVRKLAFYYETLGTKANEKREQYLLNAVKRHNLSEKELTLVPQVQIAEKSAHEYLANVADINSGDNFNNTSKGTVYVVKCKGGGRDGVVVTTDGAWAAARAAEACLKEGGCAQICQKPAYVIPGHVLAEYGDFTKDKQALDAILQGVEDANRELVELVEDAKEVNLEIPLQQLAHDVEADYSVDETKLGKTKALELKKELKKSLKSSWHY